MREDGRKQVYIVGLQEFEVSDVQIVKEYIERANAARSIGSTGANEESSRSHAILQLAVKKHIIVTDTRRQRDRDANESKSTKAVGKFSFINLAGSERGADATNNDRVKSLSKGENTRKYLPTGPTIPSSRKSSANPSYPMSVETDEMANPIQEKRPVETSRKGAENFTSNSSVEPDRNSVSMIPSYSNRPKDENGASGLSDRDRVDLNFSRTNYSSKPQPVQNSANAQEEEKVTKVSPRRKAYNDDKSKRLIPILTLQWH
ncbi:hypothetical protein ABZP36_029261 [Zizania latifolia]